MISIHELHRVLARKGEFKDCDTLKVARFLIEPANLSSIEYNQKLETKFEVALKKLLELLGDYEIVGLDKEEMRQRVGSQLGVNSAALLDKFKSVEKKGKVTFDAFEKILSDLKVSLDPVEKSYCVYAMYEKTKNLDKLQYEFLLEILKEKSECAYGDDFDKESKTSKHKENFASDKESSHAENLNKQEEPNKEEEYEDDFNEEEKVHKEDSAEKASELEEKELNDENPYADEYAAEDQHQEALQDLEISGEQLTKILDEGLTAILRQMQALEINLESLFGDSITQETVEGQQTNVIPTKSFLAEIKKLNIEGLSEVHQVCLVEALAIDEGKNFIKFDDLEQILNDYDLHNMGIEGLDYSSLDGLSLVLLLALTDHLIANKTPLYVLLEDYIYTQPVTGPNGTQRTVEAIEAEGFFKALKVIGIELEAEKHENLQRFLAIVSDDVERLSVDKLGEAIRKFATNEQLREEAQRHYEELLDEKDD
eukprot:TRINITY_DN10066_c0_g7_i1.p1 TRINITY_DN10066_c0_g7~~TRINITY_DN10066_c0_g7_i1.p1  ORF type:complete len:483 (-),score=161.92 TRINITY_DN10066_c0_g7_i1:156-1604(-)